MSVDEDPKNKKLTLFVRNLPDNATKEQLDLVFSEVGKIRHCFVVKKGQQFKGIGYVTFTNDDDVKSALGRSFKLGSNELSVTLAEDKKKQGKTTFHSLLMSSESVFSLSVRVRFPLR